MRRKKKIRKKRKNKEERRRRRRKRRKKRRKEEEEEEEEEEGGGGGLFQCMEYTCLMLLAQTNAKHVDDMLHKGKCGQLHIICIKQKTFTSPKMNLI
jgi:hypothetical protein